MVRAAIVGLGWWGKIMVDAVQWTSDRLRFTHALVRRPEMVREYAADRHLKLAMSFEALLDAPEVDAVVLATPHSAHLEQILACARAKKPVFSEKPLALTLADARRAVLACEDAGIVLGLGTDRRALPAVKRLKAIVDAGTLGELIHLEGQYSNDTMTRGLSGDWRASAHEAPGGGMTGPGLHCLDALVHFGGAVAEIRGQLARPRGVGVPTDSVSLLLRFGSGATGLLGSVRGVPDYFRVALFGDRGWAEVRNFGELQVHAAGQPRTSETYDPALAVGDLLERFADAVAGRANFPVTTLSMLQTMAGFEAALASFETAQAVPVAQARLNG
jgi:predicted dehydrogenase